jgi:hypothetical protein
MPKSENMPGNKMIRFALVCLLPAILGIYSCEKVEKGFLSDSIYYIENPFTVQQGITTTSATLVADGSTNPLKVTLLSIRDKKTGAKIDSLFLTPKMMSTYTGGITYEDSTLALLKAKLKDSMVAPFSINSIGGRLQFTQTTLYVDPGSYTIDVKVSNIKGERTLQDACNIIVTPIATIDTITYKSWTTADAAGTFYTLPATLQMDVKHDAQGPGKIIFQWKDKNGHFFNPAAGEVYGRDQRPSFRHWDPYYQEVKTDTSIEYEYPQGVPEFPVFAVSSVGFNDGICYYRVDRKYTDIGLHVNTVSAIKYYVTRGSYTVTYYLNNVERK